MAMAQLGPMARPLARWRRGDGDGDDKEREGSATRCLYICPNIPYTCTTLQRGRVDGPFLTDYVLWAYLTRKSTP
jgi:hypothetical protein